MTARRVPDESTTKAVGSPTRQQFGLDGTFEVTDNQHLPDLASGGEYQPISRMNPDPEITIDSDRTPGTSLDRD